MRYVISFILGFFITSCIKSQVPIPTYSVTVVNANLDTITSLISVDATGRVDTLNIYSVRKYHPPVPPIPPSGFTFAVDTISYSSIDVVAAGRGANSFYTWSANPVRLPDANAPPQAFDNDYRFYWGQLQTGPTSYNWSVFDNVVNQCIAAGQKLSFGIMSCDATYSGLAYPSFIGTTKTPDWNSEAYLSGIEKFLQALSDHLNSTNFRRLIYHIDIRMMGNYGEWHYFGISTNPLATSVSLKRIIDAHTKAFPDIPLVSIISAFRENSNIPIDAAAYLLMASNSWGRVGIRSDHLGDNGNYIYDTKGNTRVYNGVNFYNEIMNRYKTSPMCGEPMNDKAKVTNGGNCAFWDLENETRGFHLTQFSNQNGTGVSASCLNTNYINASKASGYRLQIMGGSYVSVNSGLILTLNWSNIGIAPVYENWNTTFELRNGATLIWSGKSSFNPKLFLPGKAIVIDNFTSIPLGTYSLYVIVKDPLGYRKPLSLTNKNRAADGSYFLSTITIK